LRWISAARNRERVRAFFSLLVRKLITWATSTGFTAGSFAPGIERDVEVEGVLALAFDIDVDEAFTQFVRCLHESSGHVVEIDLRHVFMVNQQNRPAHGNHPSCEYSINRSRR
jgi:hypothetical protein